MKTPPKKTVLIPKQINIRTTGREAQLTAWKERHPGVPFAKLGRVGLELALDQKAEIA